MSPTYKTGSICRFKGKHCTFLSPIAGSHTDDVWYSFIQEAANILESQNALVKNVRTYYLSTSTSLSDTSPTKILCKTDPSIAASCSRIVKTLNHGLSLNSSGISSGHAKFPGIISCDDWAILTLSALQKYKHNDLQQVMSLSPFVSVSLISNHDRRFCEAVNGS